MESKEKFEVIVEAWNGMITGSRYDALSAFKEMKEGKITFAVFIAKLNDNEKRVFNIFSFVMIVAFTLGIDGESEQFLAISKSQKEYSEFIYDLQSGRIPTQRAENEGETLSE